jgi:DNA-binding response OmpR family regulator
MDILQEVPVTLLRTADLVAEDVPEEFWGYVLIVGTDPGFLKYYQDIFLGLGFTPLVGTSYESVLASLRLIVFDFIVVAQSSLAFEGRFVMGDDWRHDDRTRVLVITKGNDPGRGLDVKNLGAVDYLHHPVAVPEIVRAITAHLQSDALSKRTPRTVCDGVRMTVGCGSEAPFHLATAMNPHK